MADSEKLNMSYEMAGHHLHDHGHGVYPPRGACMNWELDLVWPYVAGEIGTFIAYLVIAYALVRMERKVKITKVIGHTFWLFASFIFVCGIDHLIGALAIWFPEYRIIVNFKVVLMIVSLTSMAFFLAVSKELTAAAEKVEPDG